MRDASPVIYEANISNGGRPSFFVLLPMKIITSRNCSHKIARKLATEWSVKIGREDLASVGKLYFAALRTVCVASLMLGEVAKI
jgi:hypothetical protein